MLKTKEDPSILTLKAMLRHSKGTIAYEPLAGEPDWRLSPIASDRKDGIVVLPTDRGSDPFEWARTCEERFSGSNSYILIPGAQFDLYGTRHGRGGGWYDRFLSAIPREWLRIGLTHKDRLSAFPLLREAWDEPVDWLLVRDEKAWEAHRCTPSSTKRPLVKTAGKI